MISIIQRVTEAQVAVNGKVIGKINRGMLVLTAVERTDTIADAQWSAIKLATMRIFQNAEKHFDADIKQIAGEILLVSNFTVAAATKKGRRPTFDPAADPAEAQKIFDDLIQAIRAQNIPLQTGKFGAAMLVSLVNDGPATFLIQSENKSSL
jgi:D-tyrosyl-tRNA(Tyr) deacylase